MIICQPDDALSDQAWAAIQAWEARENSVLYSFVCEEAITPHLISHALCDSDPRLPAPRVDVILQSLGGDIEAAYKLLTHLHGDCAELRVFIPDYAKSAATFFALGAHEIWLGRDAELGPLDAQIIDPRHADEYMSALEQFGAIDYLRQHGYEMLDQFVMTTLRRTNMTIEGVLSHAVEYTTGMMQALYNNVDPLDFGRAHRSLSMSEEYGRRVMTRYGYADRPPSEVREIVRTLTWNYPSHSFVIDYEEAEEIGLRVRRMTDEMEDNLMALLPGITTAIGYFGRRRNDEQAVPPETQGDTGEGDGRPPRRPIGQTNGHRRRGRTPRSHA
ncbi:MAG TPA: hypothetical protein VFB22_04775 [Candidatus Baltobacteraceae bacterium]|nr:hypothetical protein [Candidatus Baltobacteraceae bacterium]